MELRFDFRQLDPVLRALRSGNARLHRRQIHFQKLAILDLARLRHPEQALRLEVLPEGIHLIVGPARRGKIPAGLFIYREEAHRRAVFRSHVRDRRPVGQPERRRAFAVELDKLADDFGLSQHLGDGQH